MIPPTCNDFNLSEAAAARPANKSTCIRVMAAQIIGNATDCFESTLVSTGAATISAARTYFAMVCSFLSIFPFSSASSSFYLRSERVAKFARWKRFLLSLSLSLSARTSEPRKREENHFPPAQRGRISFHWWKTEFPRSRTRHRWGWVTVTRLWILDSARIKSEEIR